MTEQWYTAKCYYIAAHTGNEPPHEPLREYRYLLIRGLDETDAMTKAQHLPRNGNTHIAISLVQLFTGS